MHNQGYTSDFWMASFGIFAALVFGTTAVVLVRTWRITWLYVLLFVIGLSIIPFFLLSYLFDTILVTTPNFKEYVMVNLSSTFQYYLYFFFFTGLCIMVETLALFMRFYYKPTLADYFRWLIKIGKVDQPEYFDKEILQNFMRMQDPIPKKKPIEWSDIISRSQIAEDKSAMVELESMKDEEDEEKNIEEEKLKEGTNMANNTTTGTEDTSKRTLVSVFSPFGDSDRPSITGSEKFKAAGDHPVMDEQPNPQFCRPRRIKSREIDEDDSAEMDEQLEEAPKSS
jgi:hypothetical protein